MVFHNNVWLMMILALSVSKQKVQEWFSVVVLSYQKVVALYIICLISFINSFNNWHKHLY